MPFQKYEKQRGGRGGSGPRISLRKSETIGVNGAAMTEFLDDVEAVVLYYDDEANRVGLEPAEPGDGDAYRLQRSENGNGASLNAGAFMREFGLIPEQTTQYRASWDDDADLLAADLDDAVLVYGED